uniref:Uncharacterized protein n=1 Tax=Cacopsylla melanoneura TaxID=428564 RepID=A0A8D9A3F6_9HEMI
MRLAQRRSGSAQIPRGPSRGTSHKISDFANSKVIAVFSRLYTFFVCILLLQTGGNILQTECPSASCGARLGLERPVTVIVQLWLEWTHCDRTRHWMTRQRSGCDRTNDRTRRGQSPTRRSSDETPSLTSRDCLDRVTVSYLFPGLPGVIVDDDSRYCFCRRHEPAVCTGWAGRGR